MYIYTLYYSYFLLENFKSVPNSGDEMWNVFTLLGWRIWWPRGAACCWWPWNMMDSARRRDHPTRREADGGWIRLPPDTCRYQKLMCPALKWRSSDKNKTSISRKLRSMFVKNIGTWWYDGTFFQNTEMYGDMDEICKLCQWSKSTMGCTGEAPSLWPPLWDPTPGHRWCPERQLTRAWRLTCPGCWDSRFSWHLTSR